ncbi:MAG: T9SS type A sorting domain-containing protein [Bacteroidetes bacterium]|nr:T9SS type A sorting domain-containing protein [Bacteroidota bacterium]
MRTMILSCRILTGLFFLTFLLFSNAYSLDDVLKIRITGNGLSDETIIRFLPGATTAFDGSYDAYKLFGGNPLAPTLYTTIPTLKLSINALPLLIADVTVPLATEIGVASTCTLEAIEMGLFSNDVVIILEDLVNDKFILFKDSVTYTVNLVPNIPSSGTRFLVHFITPLIATGVNATCNNAGNGMGIVNKSNSGSWDCLWTNLDGDTLKFTDNTNGIDTIKGLSEGNYIIKMNKSYLCSFTDTILITEPSVILADFIENPNSPYFSTGQTIQFLSISTGASAFLWDFGDGSGGSDIENPTHTYTQPGNYKVTLVAGHGGCDDTISRIASVTSYEQTGTDFPYQVKSAMEVFPNPAGQTAYVKYNNHDLLYVYIDIYNASGQKMIATVRRNAANNLHEVDLSALSEGYYIVKVRLTSEENEGKIYEMSQVIYHTY